MADFKKVLICGGTFKKLPCKVKIGAKLLRKIIKLMKPVTKQSQTKINSFHIRGQT